MAITIEDLPVITSGDVQNTDLLLVHRLIGSDYVPAAVVRGDMLHDVLKTASAASVQSLTASTSISGQTLSAASASLSSFLQMGDRITKVYRSNTATVTSEEIAAGAAFSTVLTATGALAGDFCVLATPGLPNGIITRAEAGTNQVTVALYNATAAPITVTLTVSAAVFRVIQTP
jgi:hypothetical protein